MFSEAQYTDTEILIYSYFVDQKPVQEEEKTHSFFTCVYEENGVYYCASTTQNGVYRYSYCLNNPLIFTDPSGEFIGWVIGGAILGSYIGGALASDNLNPFTKQYWQDGWEGAIVGGIAGAGIGALGATVFGGQATYGLMISGVPGEGASLGWSITSSALKAGNLQMGIEAITSKGDLDAIWKAGVSGLVGGGITGGVNNWIDKGINNIGFFEGFGIHGASGGISSYVDGYFDGKRGDELFKYTMKGAVKSGLVGGFFEGYTAMRYDGRNFWTGGKNRRDLVRQNYIPRKQLVQKSRSIKKPVIYDKNVVPSAIPFYYGSDYSEGIDYYYKFISNTRIRIIKPGVYFEDWFNIIYRWWQ